jgi:UDP-3-O-[3-hydroxymyristoyl] glucosamine N-acyltransferase
VIIQSGAVIGSDGFGYAWTGREHLKIPQAGRVILEEDVEIGANTCIDRGAIGDTVIRRGVKLDNLIQIGHNVEIGAFSIMASQVGISGSTTVGQGCQFGGQVGTAGHIQIGDGCKIAAKSGVAGNLEAGGTYAGIPVMPHRVWLKVSAMLPRLPALWSKLSALGFK